MQSPIKMAVVAARWARLPVFSAIALGLVSGLLCASARADWEVGASVGAFYDDNLTRAQDALDVCAERPGAVR